MNYITSNDVGLISYPYYEGSIKKLKNVRNKVKWGRKEMIEKIKIDKDDVIIVLLIIIIFLITIGYFRLFYTVPR